MAERGVMNAMPSMDSAGAMNRGRMVGASAGMMRDMRAHDQSLMSMRGSTLMAVIPEHRRRTANLVSQTQMDMSAGEIATTSPWDAVVDSVLRDLAQLPDLEVAGVTAMMPTHRARIR
ncbi:MAG: hypothetical protein H7247_00860 [Polaromonas sp.]|nr:hypothetical protein [Gemmatimonadaceae bacterium]